MSKEKTSFVVVKASFYPTNPKEYDLKLMTQVKKHAEIYNAFTDMLPGLALPMQKIMKTLSKKNLMWSTTMACRRFINLYILLLFVGCSSPEELLQIHRGQALGTTYIIQYQGNALRYAQNQKPLIVF